MHISGTDVSDSQFVTLKLEIGNFLRFQVDAGAQCNVVPMDLYKKTTTSLMSHLVSTKSPCTVVPQSKLWTK